MEESAEQDVLRSELWTTLFRGGYMIGKLERSLSGKFAAEDSGTELTFLWDLVNKKEGAPTNFLQKYVVLAYARNWGRFNTYMMRFNTQWRS